MAVGKTTQAIDRITPKQTGGLRVIFSQHASTELDVPLSTLLDSDYITKKQFDQNNSGGAQVTTSIIGGTTPNPIAITYGTLTWPTVLCRNADGSLYSGAVNSVDDGTVMTVTGDDDGTGKFADSFTIIIKP